MEEERKEERDEEGESIRQFNSCIMKLAATRSKKHATASEKVISSNIFRPKLEK